MVNVKRLRCFIGWLAILLPWLLALILKEIPPSISYTYYTHAGTVFTIILGSASVLLMYYDGYEKADDIINTAASFFGFAICLFPCEVQADKVGVFQIKMEISAVIHNVCAVIFFAILAYNSFFQFTKNNGTMSRNKRIRNAIYRICGIGMIGAFALFALPHFYCKIWLIETIALFFFGVSWLTKANAYKWLFAEKD